MGIVVEKFGKEFDFGLRTERLILRKFKVEDAEEVFENWASDPEVTRYLTWEAHENVEATREYLKGVVKSYAKGDYYNFAVENEEGRLIGNIEPRILREGVADFGYCFGKEFWGKGYGTEALKEILRFCFEDLRVNTVVGEHYGRNPASGRVMEKVGMKYEATLRERVKDKVEGDFDDMVEYSMTREEWEG